MNSALASRATTAYSLARNPFKSAGSKPNETTAAPVAPLVQSGKGWLTAHLGVLEKGHVVFIQKVDGPGMIKFDTYVGKRAAVHCTGLGKALLACSTDQIVRECLAVESFVKYTDATITSTAAFRKELARVKQKGYAIDDEEEEVGVRCLAAPVFKPLGELISAVSVTGTTAQIPSGSFSKLAETVKETSAKISKSLKVL